ncbi:MAG: HNH endonuclease [Terriglobales bacterium]
MSSIRTKHCRLRLDPESYQRLCTEVLRRDGWKCQSCGRSRNLQIHHKEFRSQSGDDSEENLITLCTACHMDLHRGVRG